MCRVAENSNPDDMDAELVKRWLEGEGDEPSWDDVPQPSTAELRRYAENIIQTAEKESYLTFLRYCYNGGYMHIAIQIREDTQPPVAEFYWIEKDVPQLLGTSKKGSFIEDAMSAVHETDVRLMSIGKVTRTFHPTLCDMITQQPTEGFYSHLTKAELTRTSQRYDIILSNE